MLMQPNAAVIVSYTGIPGQSLTVQGVTTACTAALFDVGLTAHMSTRMSVRVGYRGTPSSDVRARGVEVLIASASY